MRMTIWPCLPRHLRHQPRRQALPAGGENEREDPSRSALGARHPSSEPRGAVGRSSPCQPEQSEAEPHPPSTGLRARVFGELAQTSMSLLPPDSIGHSSRCRISKFINQQSPVLEVPLSVWSARRRKSPRRQKPAAPEGRPRQPQNNYPESNDVDRLQLYRRARGTRN